MKECTKCRVSKIYSEFYRNKGTSSGLQSWCKSCHQEDTRAYKKRNKEHLAKKKAEWDRCNRLKTKEYVLRRRARLKNNRTSIVSYAKILERDGYTCHLCSFEIPKELKYPHPQSISFDHVIPLSLGGEHSMDNIKPAHFTCNNKKSNKLPGRW